LDKKIDPSFKRAGAIHALSVIPAEAVTQLVSITGNQRGLTKKGRMIIEGETNSHGKLEQKEQKAPPHKLGITKDVKPKIATTLNITKANMATTEMFKNRAQPLIMTDKRMSSSKIINNNFPTSATKVMSKRIATARLADLKLATTKITDKQKAFTKMYKVLEVEVTNSRRTATSQASSRMFIAKVAANRVAPAVKASSKKTTPKKTTRKSAATKMNLAIKQSAISETMKNTLAIKTSAQKTKVVKAKISRPKALITKGTTVKGTPSRKAASKLAPTKALATKKAVYQKGSTKRPSSKAVPKKQRVKQLRQQWEHLSERIPPNVKLNKKLKLPGSQESGRYLFLKSNFL